MKHYLKVCFVLCLVLIAVLAFAACSEEETTAVTPEATTTTAPITTGVIPVCKSHTLSTNGTYCTVCYTVVEVNKKEYNDMVYFNCDNETLTKAYQVAFDDISGNIHNYKAGILTSMVPCIMAGGDYNTPWTRDASINVWNAVALMRPDVAKNTLMSVLKKVNSTTYRIDGEYWDAIIWAIGAEQYINVTHDEEFTRLAQNAIYNSLVYFEKTEYDSKDGLFRGGAVYGDGISAYPDKYATDAPSSNVMGWLYNPNNTESAKLPGVGLSMKALSTNCCYYEAYVILARLNAMLGLDTTEALKKAEAMKKAINDAFWNEEKGSYDYLAYECDYQEAIGLGFVLLFGIADERQTALVLQNTVVTEQGIGIVWPSFDRYLALGEYGRHAGVIWPHGQAFWAQACGKAGYAYGYEYELFLMAEKAVANGQFHEIYHPDTGLPYGGIQEVGGDNITMSYSCENQTWSATGYLSLIYYNLLGADITSDSVTFTPYLPEGVNEATFSDFKVGNMTFDVVIVRGGDGAKTATFDTTQNGKVRVFLSVE